MRHTRCALVTVVQTFSLPILRLERSAASAEKIIGFLETRQEIERIYYPFYPGHPQYELARRQMKRGGGLFTVSLRVNSSVEVEKFCNALRRFLLAVAWGGYASLIMPRCLGFEAGSAEVVFNLVRFFFCLVDSEGRKSVGLGESVL